jgi:hypothetical protein
MRTTLTLDEDVIEKARNLATRFHKPFKAVVNEALRYGLDCQGKSSSVKPYRTQPREMGLKAGVSLDNIQDLLARLEGETRK